MEQPLSNLWLKSYEHSKSAIHVSNKCLYSPLLQNSDPQLHLSNIHAGEINQAYPRNQLLDIEFISVIRQLAQDKEQVSNSNSPLFLFEMNEGAAIHNASLLKSFNYDLQAAIQAQPNSPVSYRSEFHHW